jgi:uncharacterized protein (TIGR02246 family)
VNVFRRFYRFNGGNEIHSEEKKFMRSDKTFRRLTLAVAALAACALHATPPAAAAGEDETAIRENVRQMESGWNAKSGAQFAKPLAADADYVVVNGMYLKGREAIAQAHQSIFDTIYKESTLSLSVKQVRMLRPDVAVVHVAATNKYKLDAETHVAQAILTLVMTKEPGGWTIAAFQNTRVKAGR